MTSREQRGVLDQAYSASRRRKPELKFRLSVRAGIVADAVRRYSAYPTGLKILDFGAAEGRTITKMNRLLPGNSFTGIEYSQELIDSASALPENVSLIQGNVTALPENLTPNSFDVVSALAVLEHLESPLDAIQEAHRILKPAGLFVATCPVPAWDHISSTLGLLKEDHHQVEMTRKRMTEKVKEAGFELIEYRGFMWAPLSFLPYVHIPVSPRFSIGCDRWIEKAVIFNWLFVNQVVIGRRPA